MKLSFNYLSRIIALGVTYRIIGILILLSLLSTVTEIFGIGIFLPIFQFIHFKGDLDALGADSSLWENVINWFYSVGIEPTLAILLLVSFGFFISRQVLIYLRIVYSSAIRQSITQALRNRIFNGYIEANTSYHDDTPVGSLVSIITTEVNGSVMAAMLPMQLIVYFIMLASYLLVLLLLSWKMTLASIIAFFFVVIVSNIWVKKSASTGRNIVSANTTMSEFLVGRLRSPRLVRLAGTEKAEKKEFYRLTHAQRKHNMFSAILSAKVSISMEPIIISVSLIFLYISYAILQLQVETIGLYLVIVLRLLPVIKGIVSDWQKLQGVLGSLEAIEGRLKSMKDSIEGDIGIDDVNQLKQSLLIHNVSYSYPTSKSYALKDIEIEFRAGKMTAVVGPSGGGKSTLIDLLPRLRLPTKGFICIDGSDIGRYTLKSLRKMISYASQSPQIFDGTVKNHISYGKADVTHDEILEAVRLAGAEEFINDLPQGLDTVLGEDAVKLSGGQRQRLDLARVLVKKAPILILDEPTSNLDAESEDVFMQALYKIHAERKTTIIIITHRLRSTLYADNIIVLKQGKVKESGSHSKLLQQNGWYAKVWKMQELENLESI